MSSQKQHLKISIVLPCYFGASLLEQSLPIIEEIQKNQDYHWEFLVISDGQEEIEHLKTLQKESRLFKLVSLNQHQGKGGAVKRGVIEACGDFILFTDIDLPFEIKNLNEMVEKLQQGADIVIGDRIQKDSVYFQKISIRRKWASYTYIVFVRLLFGSLYGDTQCGLKAFKKEIAKSLFTQVHHNGFSFDLELLLKAKKRKLKIFKLPVQLRKTETTSSQVRLVTHGLSMFIEMLGLRLRQ